MKGNIKNIQSESQKIDNALNTFIKNQGILTNAASGVN